MIDFQVKHSFFDRAKVMRAADKTTRRVFSRFGAFVRTTAKQSIRKRKGPARPGMPPHSHVGTLKRHIYFSYDARAKDVVIGPIPIGSRSGAPASLEHGGTIGGTANPRRRRRVVGGSGEIRIGGKRSRATRKNKEGKWVTYGRLTNQTMADRANRLNEELYGPEKLTGIPIKRRPYMGPAFAKELPKLPSMWANSIG